MTVRFKPWLLGWVIAVFTFAASGQTISPQQIKSAYLIRFFDYITWEGERDIKVFRIGVAGGDEALFRELTNAVKTLRAKGRSITVTRTANLKDMPGFHLLFVSRNTDIPLHEIAVATQRTNTLIVTDESNEQRYFMINLVTRPDNTIGFEINKSNIVFERLKMNNDILLLGGTELDVAKLFKESEYEIAKMKEQLTVREKELAGLQDELTKQKEKLDGQTLIIEKQIQDIKTREKTLSDMHGRLEQASGQLDESRKNLRENESMLAGKLQTLNEREARIADLSSSITENSALLERQKQEISEQSKILKVQKSSLQQQGSTIQEQRLWLLVAGIALTVFILLTGIILYINNDRKKVNAKLSAAKETAENASRNLALSERNFRSMVETIPGTVYQHLFDEHWTMKYLSDDIESLCGYPASDFLENKVRSFASIIHPEDAVQVNEVIRAAIPRRESYTLEFRVLHTDGSVHWVYEKGMGIFDSEGNLEVLDGTLLDITVRKQVEMELASREEQFRILLDATPDGIIIVDTEGRIVIANAQVKELFQYEPRELIGTSLEKLIPENLRESHIITRNSYLEKPVVREMGAGMELFALRKDGTKFSAEISLSPIVTPQGLRVISSVRDVTRRKQAEEELQQSEYRLSLAMRAAQLYAWDADLKKDIVRYDKEYFIALGYEPDEIEDNHASYNSKIIFPDDLPGVLEERKRISEEKASVFDLVYRVKTKDGVPRWVKSVGSVATWDKDGFPVRVFGTIQDITREKEAETLINEKISQLEEFNRLAVGRELRMIELKHQINELLNRLGEDQEYEIVE